MPTYNIIIISTIYRKEKKINPLIENENKEKELDKIGINSH